MPLTSLPYGPPSPGRPDPSASLAHGFVRYCCSGVALPVPPGPEPERLRTSTGAVGPRWWTVGSAAEYRGASASPGCLQPAPRRYQPSTLPDGAVLHWLTARTRLEPHCAVPISRCRAYTSKLRPMPVVRLSKSLQSQLRCPSCRSPAEHDRLITRVVLTPIAPDAFPSWMASRS